MRKSVLLIGIFIFVTSFTAFTQVNFEEISDNLLQNHLTMQIGLDYSLVGFTMVNEMNEPIFSIGTCFLGVVARITLNPPNKWEIQDTAQEILDDFPTLTQERLQAKTAEKISGSRSLTFLEFGFFLFPSEYGIFFIPFFGGGVYVPLGTTSSFLVAHFNLPFIGGIGIIYVF